MIPTPTDHPLPRDGTSQGQRDLAALQPSYAPLDDRGLAELLVFAHRYSNLLLYYNHERRVDGTWQPFFDQFPVIQLALIAQNDTNAAKDAYDQFITVYRHAVASDNDIQRTRALRALLKLAVSEILGIDHWAMSFTGHVFHEEIEKVSANTILPEIEAVIQFAKAYFTDQARDELAPLKKLQDDFWDLDIASIHPTQDILDDTPDHNAIALKDELNELLEVIFKARAYLADKASVTLESPDIETGDQTPHLGLALAFLKLFGIAQIYLNDITRQHLEFYYHEILGIQGKAATPDSAFVVFELAKRIESETIAKATLLSAGKDDSKKPIQFATDREITVNTAKLASVKSLFVETADQSRIAAAAIANSGDGIGGDLNEEDPSWPLFGKSSLPAGRVGFAFSSHTLKVTGGSKSISIQIDLTEESSKALDTAIQDLDDPDNLIAFGHNSALGHFHTLTELFEIRFTGLEAWLNPGVMSVLHYTDRNRIAITIGNIDATMPIAPYNAELHGELYDTSDPILEFLLRSDRSLYALELLSEIEYSKVELRNFVSDDRFLIAANDLGPVDVSKPFLPFGPQPSASQTNATNPDRSTTGSSFFVGSQEIFSKRLEELTFSIEWKDRPQDLDDYYADYTSYVAAQLRYRTLKELPEFTVLERDKVQIFLGPTPGAKAQPEPEPETLKFLATVSYLSKGVWRDLGSKTVTLLQPNISFTADELTLLPADPDLPSFEKLILSTTDGFLRLTLSTPSWGFGHALYPKILTSNILAAVRAQTDPPPPPNEPYSPTIASLAATYTAVSVLQPSGDFDTGDLALLHIEPHGVLPGPSQQLMPKFAFAAASYIGLSDLAPKQTVSLLFELVDGSGNPFVDYPTLTWSYLAGDAWVDFAVSEIITDSTNDLRRTGIAAFSIPPAATLSHTRMPPARIWIRATVDRNPDAVHRAIAIAPQAVQATFLDQGNDLNRLALPLEPGTIAKFVRANTRVKSIAQPIASSDGAIAECGGAYYRRVSERLRHKDRAVQIWDYEKLVLEAFPEVYKVKSIPHTARAPSSSSSDDVTSELSPGDVLVVLVPNLQNRVAYNPLQPAVSQDTLAEVEAFLQARASHFSRIKTVNPRYEEIEVIGEVFIHSDYDTGAYQEILEEDVIAYLTPWAVSSEAQIVFGKSMHSSQILNFIEELPYVDYLENFYVRHYVNGTAITPDPQDLVPTAEHSILVSTPTHRLTVKKRATVTT